MTVRRDELGIDAVVNPVTPLILSAGCWDNGIGGALVGVRNRNTWVSNCVMAVTHMLLVEYWKDATASNVRKWRAEIVESREKMAAAVDAGRGLQG